LSLFMRNSICGSGTANRPPGSRGAESVDVTRYRSTKHPRLSTSLMDRGAGNGAGVYCFDS
jgi:hypothetical protein